jgi:hypothetical protein
VLALTHHTGIRLAEVGFLLILVAGVWLVAAQVPRLRLSATRTIIAGMALGVADERNVLEISAHLLRSSNGQR